MASPTGGVSEPVTVRPATEAEIDEVGELWREMYAHQRAHGMILPLRDDAVDVWKRQLAGRLDSPVSVVLVALADAALEIESVGQDRMTSLSPSPSSVSPSSPSPSSPSSFSPSPSSLSLSSSSPSGGGKLLGFLTAQTKRLPPHLATSRPKVGFMGELYVRAEARGRRVGHALVDAALAWFALAEVGSIELQVLVGNPDARRFWEGMGFVPELLQMRRA